MQIVLNDSSHNNSFTLFNYLLTFIRSVTFAKLPILFQLEMWIDTILFGCLASFRLVVW